MPDQIKRLLVVAVVVLAGFLAARHYLMPKDFGELGHFRSSAVDSVADLPIKYAGHQACFECHDDIHTKKSNSYHRKVNCEACHGPAAEHVASMGDVLPAVPRDRANCVLCHVYNPAKPSGFPQIDPVAHNPVKPCISCHDPHAPNPPSTPGECNACHGNIARTKALSPHALLECIRCHVTPEGHKLTPRSVRAGKFSERADCGQCHDQDAVVDKLIPRVDVARHGGENLCWQCHYPHSPEASK